jgi:hypothetical protein
LSRPSKWSICFRFPHQNPICISLPPCTCYMPWQPHLSPTGHKKDECIPIMKVLTMHFPVTFSLLGPPLPQLLP